MKTVWNVILGLGAAISAAALLLQGFAFPALSTGVMVLLRLAAAVCVQWLFLRLFQKKLLQAIPALIAGCFSCWGYFLYLTSPSWRNATFGHFLRDNASYLGGCLLVCGLAWLLPRLIPRIKKAIRKKLRKAKKAKQNRVKQ